jgi:hypothetical protein
MGADTGSVALVGREGRSGTVIAGAFTVADWADVVVVFVIC